uniref:CTP synthase n=1 Tax=Calcidiscus leptoporus TaxID=127549 RepID=A0A7S0IZT8_9EUKA|mmetsp:Transcript_3119/g.7051  ORF Transcript_3119/g.7051 Transcript_3119/m.7051 type:complete len:710 (+) Transcript_3119:69-2198(+)
MVSIASSSARAHEVLVARHADHIELTVSSVLLKQPCVYAFAPTEPLSSFFAQLAGDVGCMATDVQLVASSGATLSALMSHSFAWKPGRSLTVTRCNAEAAEPDVTSFAVSLSDAQEAATKVPATPRGSMRRHSSSFHGGSGIPSAEPRLPMKYVVVTGGVVSGLGKGVTASSLGVLLKCAGYRVTSMKIDPYLNVDAGTMSPFEHGEVFTLDDGGEVDLDLGNYERFIGITLARDNNITTGKIYQTCLERERKGDYLGKTVQVVPHLTDAIMQWIERVAHIPADGLPGHPNVCVIELGGTVGDIESMPFIEALRQFQFRVGRENMCFLHVSLVPVIGVVGEEKTKPTQHSVQQLRAVGLTPDFLVCRSGKPLAASTKHKLALFCHVPPEHCIGVHDVSNIYRVPLLLNHQGVTARLLDRLDLPPARERIEAGPLSEWISLAELVDSLTVPVSIAVVGKYTELSDAYLSVTKALSHASFAVEHKLVIEWIDSSKLDDEHKQVDLAEYEEAWASLKKVDGVMVPGGFGIRAVEGKLAAAKYARENGVPYLGVCLGFQVAVIEFARSVLGHTTAHSAEFDEETAHKLIVFMPEVSRTHMGGTMRLGARRTVLKHPQCKTAQLYDGATAFDERHRHRYEVNIDYVKELEESGMEFVGRDVSGERMEVFELHGHPYFVGCQFHPEFKSRPTKPSPLFFGLLQAAVAYKNTQRRE